MNATCLYCKSQLPCHHTDQVITSSCYTLKTNCLTSGRLISSRFRADVFPEAKMKVRKFSQPHGSRKPQLDYRRDSNGNSIHRPRRYPNITPSSPHCPIGVCPPQAPHPPNDDPGHAPARGQRSEVNTGGRESVCSV